MIHGSNTEGLRICVLASSSSGNSILVASAETALLIDAGLSCRETVRRLGMVGVEPEQLGGICLTHEHGDHTGGIRVLQKKYQIPLYANQGTREGFMVSSRSKGAQLEWNIFTTGVRFPVGDLLVEPFAVPHDAYDPVGYVISWGDVRIGIATDMGTATAGIKAQLSNCDALVVETNHDPAWLETSGRPYKLINRIKGCQGHLSNRAAADMVAEVASPRLQHVFLAHLSGDCNHPDKALAEVARSLRIAGHHHVKLECTGKNSISSVFHVVPDATLCCSD